MYYFLHIIYGYSFGDNNRRFKNWQSWHRDSTSSVRNRKSHWSVNFIFPPFSSNIGIHVRIFGCIGSSVSTKSYFEWLPIISCVFSFVPLSVTKVMKAAKTMQRAISSLQTEFFHPLVKCNDRNFVEYENVNPH